MLKLLKFNLIRTKCSKLNINLFSKARICNNLYKFKRFKSDLNSTTQFQRFQVCRLITSYTESDIEFLDDFAKDFSEGFEDNLVQLKNLLYPKSTDPIIIKMNESSSADEALLILKDLETKLTKEHVCQLILVLWDHLKLDNETLENQSLDQICAKLDEFLEQLDSTELSVCLLYLNKMGANVKHPTLQNLSHKCIQLIERKDSEFPLTALSRFSVALNSIRGELYSQLLFIKAIPSILKFIENCETAEQIRLISVTLNNMHLIITKPVLDIYKKKIEELLDKSVLNKNNVKSVLKIINFLNFPHWSIQNTFLIRRLMLILKDSVDQLQSRELVILNRAFHSQLESAQMLPLITERARSLMKISPNIELLSSAVLYMYSLPEQRQEMSELTEHFICTFDVKERRGGNELQMLFKILRLLKISDVKLCNTYWEKVMEDVKQSLDESVDNFYQIARYCHRYMHFNNNLGGTYRHKGFERYLSKLIVNELQFGLSSFIPSKFAKFSSFIIAYNGLEPKAHTIPSFIIDKIVSMSDQFSVIDCLQISRSLQILHEMRYRYFIPTDLAAQIVAIENVLNTCAKRHTEVLNLSLTDINCIIRTYNNRKSSKATHIFQLLLNLYNEVSPQELNSRSIRDIVFNLNASNYRLDTILNSFYKYIWDNAAHISGDTVEKIIYCGFNLGYAPESDQIFEKCSEIILRDFNYMSGLSIVQASLALSHYKALKEDLINQVFSIDFIRRLEIEIKMCYSKATYPQRVLNQVMQLNRSICLDYPEVNLPWFQQNYIEAQMSKLPAVSPKFNHDVKSFLLELVPKPEMLITNFVTPYGYRIDFVLHMNHSKKFVTPINSSDSVSSNINKIAIVLLKPDAFCENDTSLMKGSESLRMRHLEILGYKVLQIKYNDWNSMYLNIEGAKQSFLKNLLQLT